MNCDAIIAFVFICTDRACEVGWQRCVFGDCDGWLTGAYKLERGWLYGRALGAFGRRAIWFGDDFFAIKCQTFDIVDEYAPNLVVDLKSQTCATSASISAAKFCAVVEGEHIGDYILGKKGNEYEYGFYCGHLSTISWFILLFLRVL